MPDWQQRIEAAFADRPASIATFSKNSRNTLKRPMTRIVPMD